jgi:hypothetical protein
MGAPITIAGEALRRGDEATLAWGMEGMKAVLSMADLAYIAGGVLR